MACDLRSGPVPTPRHSAKKFNFKFNLGIQNMSRTDSHFQQHFRPNVSHSGNVWRLDGNWKSSTEKPKPPNHLTSSDELHPTCNPQLFVVRRETGNATITGRKAPTLPCCYSNRWERWQGLPRMRLGWKPNAGVQTFHCVGHNEIVRGEKSRRQIRDKGNTASNVTTLGYFFNLVCQIKMSIQQEKRNLRNLFGGDASPQIKKNLQCAILTTSERKESCHYKTEVDKCMKFKYSF